VANRTVIQADALDWLSTAALAGCSVITSLPDISEVPDLGLEGWRGFFSRAAALVMAAVPDDGVAIFFQSDIKRDGVWIDKGYLVARALEDSGAALLWHKVVCRRPAGSIAFGRASYSHMLCFSRAIRADAARSTADVLPQAGKMTWSKAMGVDACVLATRFIERETTTRTVVDPFCGYGTTLAVANAMGLDAIGVDISARKCRRARALTLAI
jgi:DNA methylase